jgi:hypothetical protein
MTRKPQTTGLIYVQSKLPLEMKIVYHSHFRVTGKRSNDPPRHIPLRIVCPRKHGIDSHVFWSANDSKLGRFPGLVTLQRCIFLTDETDDETAFMALG